MDMRLEFFLVYRNTLAKIETIKPTTKVSKTTNPNPPLGDSMIGFPPSGYSQNTVVTGCDPYSSRM
jgi:hypothetical protein